MTRVNMTLGGLLRALVESLDGDVDAAYAAAGLDYRARFTPVVRQLAEQDGMRIKDLASELGLSHSALSQTVSELGRRGWIELEAGRDRRAREVRLTPYARAQLPALERQWRATALAAASLNAELGLDLEALLRRALDALEARPFRARIAASEAELELTQTPLPGSASPPRP